MRILLIEDSEDDVVLIRETLAEEGGGVPELVCAQRLGAGLAHLAGGEFDVILLDLSLPDCRGLATFEQVHGAAPHVPVIVLTGHDDEEMALRAVRGGAQDYLVKGRVAGPLLTRSLRYAVERQRRQTPAPQQHEEELRSLDRLSGSAPTSVTGRLFGATALREQAPGLFDDLIRSYGEILDLALERRAYKVESDLPDRCRVLAERLGFLNARPRDVVEIHTTALRARLSGTPPKRAQAYVEESRLTVLEVMGHLVSYYRRYSLAAGGNRSLDSGETAAESRRHE
jgi:CheY-like chemotaxis protein